MSTAALTMNPAEEWRPAVNPWIIAIAVTLATFMEVLDTSIANVALPHIAGSLSAGQDESTWVLTSYLVSNAIVLPLSGWLSSIVGRKRFYMGCVALFTISSFLCGFAPNLPALIIFRILQGAGGGGLQPSEQAILADTFPPAKRGMAFAVYGIAVVMAPAIGPTLGGWITDNYSWRWIFFVNIPVGILSLLLTSRLIQDPPYFRRRKLSETKIDYIGLGFVALGLGALQIVLDKGQRDDWFESNFILILAIISAASLVFVIWWEWRHKDPIIDLHLFSDRTFAVSNLLMFMLGFALLGQHAAASVVFADPDGIHGCSFQEWRCLRAASSSWCCMPIVGWLLSRYDARYLLLFGLVDAVVLPVSHDELQPADRFQDCRAGSHAASGRTGVPVRPHQHISVCLPSAGKEQCGVRPDEPRAQHRRKRRNFLRDHHARSSHAKAHERPDEPPEQQ